MRRVNTKTIIEMRKELVDFKRRLLKALETGSALPAVNAQDILEKYIAKSAKELRPYMSLAQSRRMSRNTLTVNMEDIIGG